MDIFYWKSPQGNFGDDLNDWIWDQLLPGWQDWDTHSTLVGIGTILNSHHFPTSRPGRFLVAGSGVGYGDPPYTDDPARWDIRSLRGPRSARALGLPDNLGIADPAIMLSEMKEFQSLPRQGRAIFIPHLSSVDKYDWETLCEQAGVDYVSPCDDSKSVIRRIATASLVLAESMHAAIIADSFRTPWVPLSLSSSFNGAKWLDWSDSLEMPLEISPLLPVMAWLHEQRARLPRVAVDIAPPTPGAAPPQEPRARKPSYKQKLRRALESRLIPPALAATARQRPYLSDDGVLRRQKERYQAVLYQITRDYKQD